MTRQTHPVSEIWYLLLSPTFGMHQYTADLANRAAADGYTVHLVTTEGYPQDRYAPAIRVHTPITSTGTGFSREGARAGALRRVLAAVSPVFASGHPIPPPIHVTGVHLWNLPLVWALRRRGVPVIHTLHDLDPHYGRRFPRLIRLWNRLLIASGCHLLVHGRRYRERLLAQSVPSSRVTHVPLLHLFLGYQTARTAAAVPPPIRHESWALFFGRLEQYKGIDVLLQAQTMLRRDGNPIGLTLAGPGRIDQVWGQRLPDGVDLRDRLIADAEALDLFRRCGLLVLPYRDATQSALVAAAYYFRKPVIVTDVGALPEYVEPGVTGWVVPPGDPAALAECLAEAFSEPRRLARRGAHGRVWYDNQRRIEWRTLLAMYERVGR